MRQESKFGGATSLSATAGVGVNVDLIWMRQSIATTLLIPNGRRVFDSDCNALLIDTPALGSCTKVGQALFGRVLLLFDN